MAFRRRRRPGPEAAERLLDAVAADAAQARQAHGEPRDPAGEPIDGPHTDPTGHRITDPAGHEVTAPAGRRVTGHVGRVSDANGRRVSDASGDPLAELLAVAAAPARPGELDGEEAAVAAFRTVRDARALAGAAATSRLAETDDAPAGTSARPPGRRRRLTAGAFGWLVAVVATLTAGVALAAEIPALRPADPPPPSTPSVDTGPSVELTTAPPTSAPAPTSTPHGAERPAAGPGPTGHALPPHALTAQCRTFLARSGPGAGSAGRHPPSATLVRAAGGRAEVDEYCRRLLAVDPKRGGSTPGKPHDKGGPDDPPGRSTDRQSSTTGPR